MMNTPAMLWLTAVLTLAGSAVAQGAGKPTNAALRAKKLSQPFATSVAWELDYETAVQRGAAEGKVVFAYFTRSFAP